MSRIKRVNVRYGQIVFDLDDIDRIMEECWKIVRAAKKAELIYEKDKEAAEKQFRTEAAKHFEKAFGKGSCWKVFGTHYPSSTGYAEFGQENAPTADEIKAHQIRYYYDSD